MRAFDIDSGIQNVPDSDFKPLRDNDTAEKNPLTKAAAAPKASPGGRRQQQVEDESSDEETDSDDSEIVD